MPIIHTFSSLHSIDTLAASLVLHADDGALWRLGEFLLDLLLTVLLVLAGGRCGASWVLAGVFGVIGLDVEAALVGCVGVAWCLC
jgi:hypothetical protein